MKKEKKDSWAIFVAIILAILFGLFFDQNSTFFGFSLYGVINTLSKLFINALTLLIVPLVSSSIISSMARLGKEEGFRRLGGKIFSFYIITSLFAILTGLFFVNLLVPGRQVHTLPVASISLPEVGAGTLENLLLSIVPSNIIRSFSQGEMLPLVFFSLLFGYAISQIHTRKGEVIKEFFEGLFAAMMRFTHLIMKTLPYGVFCLVARVFMTGGLASVTSMSLFVLTVLLGLSVFFFLVLPLMLYLIGKVSPFRYFRAMSPALLTAFFTSSSSATLPITMECAEKRAGISNRICSFVIPLGTSINMSGSALYECVAVLFVAQSFGVSLSLLSQVVIVLISLIASMGVAGIPSGGMVAILLILKSVGLPAEGIALFIAVDRLLDMCRTTVNVFSDSCCALLIARTEGEETLLRSNGKGL
ncbi:MAG: dicarboxylate/amino acid:cation symporter [Verrucomicrobiota bacterium]|nr:dicarboxylate/amino acid:cation symporter [Verrucomicrobiota bacterium]